MAPVKWFYDKRRNQYTAWLTCGCGGHAKRVIAAFAYEAGRELYEGECHLCQVCGDQMEYVRSKEKTVRNNYMPEPLDLPQEEDPFFETPKNILDEAQEITGNGGARNSAYGHPRNNFRNIAAGWEVIFGVKVTERQVAQAMIWTKLARDLHKPGRDNLVDIAGYARTIERLDEPEYTEQNWDF